MTVFWSYVYYSSLYPLLICADHVLVYWEGLSGKDWNSPTKLP